MPGRRPGGGTGRRRGSTWLASWPWCSTCSSSTWSPSACTHTLELDKRSSAASQGAELCSIGSTVRQLATECCNEEIFHVADHPTQDANAGRRGDHPTTELPPAAAEPPTRAFAGFRTERRFGDTQNAPLPETRVEPRAWAETPYQGMPRVVESPDAPRRVYGN